MQQSMVESLRSYLKHATLRDVLIVQDIERFISDGEYRKERQRRTLLEVQRERDDWFRQRAGKR
jgi:hypothetical protein